MKKLRNFLSLVMVGFVMSIPIIGSANVDESGEQQTMAIYSTAGQNGYYKYDEKTDSYVYDFGLEYDYEPIDSMILPECASEEDGYLGELDPQYVIGNDNRELVSSPSGYLASTCLIGARFKDDRVSHGTGWLINSRYLLTAAHVVYDKDSATNTGFPKHVAVYVGASGGKFKQYLTGKVVFAGGDYVGVPDYDQGMHDDWAIVKLDNPVTVSVSYLGVHAVNSKSDMGGEYNTQGYPCDKNGCESNNPPKWDFHKMYKCKGEILDNYTRTLPMVTTTLDTYQGQSGSAVWKYRNGSAVGEAIVVAGRKYNGKTENYLILINNWLYNCISENCY